MGKPTTKATTTKVMTTKASKRRVAHARRRLRAIGRQLPSRQDRTEELYAERLDCWQLLYEAGVGLAELAELANTTPGNVKFALHKARNG